MSDTAEIRDEADASAAQETAVEPAVVRRRVDRALVAIVALGLGLRFWGLGAQSFWYDEWLTTEAVGGGLGDLVHHVATREGITPPYFLVMWVWSRLVGDGEAALRSFSAVAGAATVPVVYALARELGQPYRVARGAALLVAVNPMLVWYSQEARPYSLLALLGALSVLAVVRADRTARRSDVLWWGAACAAAVAVHYFAVFLVAGLAVGLLVRRRVAVRRVALGCVPTAVVLLALAPLALEQHSHAHNREWISGFSLSGRLEEAGRSALIGPNPGHDRLWLATLVIVVVAGAVVASRLSHRDRAIALALAGLGAVGVVLPLGAAVVGVDVFLSRYVLTSLVVLVAAAAVVLLAPRLAGLGTVGVLAVAGLWTAAVVATASDPTLQRSDWRAVAEVTTNASPDGLLVIDVGGGQSSSLHLYLRDGDTLTGDRSVSTDQIDVLVAGRSGAPCNYFVGRACGFLFLGGALPEPTASQFHLEQRYRLDQFVIERHRSDRPVEVARDDLLAPHRLAGGEVWVVDAATCR